MKLDEFEEVPCPICGSPDYEVLGHKGMHNIPLNFSLCRTCGFGYLNPRWSRERYFHFYAKEYDQYYRPEAGRENTYAYKYSGIIEIANRLQAHNLMPEKAESILDVGSGEGYFLEYLQKHHFPKAGLYAIEPSEACLPNLQKLGAHFISNDVDKDWHLAYPEKFDLIIMRHVLEHFLDPVAVLKKIASVLKPDGILYIGVPSFDNPSRPVTEDFIRNVHTSYFTKFSLDNALGMAGLKAHLSVNFSPTNLWELYAIVGKTGVEVPPKINKEEYLKSKALITDMIAEEAAPGYKLKLAMQKRLRKYRRWLKKLTGI